MAQELRHETLQSSSTTTADSVTEFRNRSSGMIHIRGIDLEAIMDAAETDEQASYELSKAPSYQGATNLSPFFRFGLSLAIQSSTTGAAQDDGAVTGHRSRRWGRGQLTLEPNESLFYNRLVTGGGILDGKATIEYEFQ